MTGRFNELTVSTELPEFEMVSVALALCPTVTLPYERFPLTPMIRVPLEDAGEGDAGELDDPPLHANAIKDNTTTPARFSMEVSRKRKR